MAMALESGNPSLVHCSDGWDRTSQLSALSQLLLDPYYRTRQGFNVLCEKDFCCFGHMFAHRTTADSKQYSPVFIQFLDAVWVRGVK
jgi:myotubularin-related protein 1/2